MLSFLKISDLAILDDVAIEFGPGLNVLTGETGAGKSILVDAIGLLLGARGSAELVREGRDRLRVEGQFDLKGRPDAGRVRAAAGDEPEDAGDEMIVRRELSAEGRGRILLNGRIVTLAALRSVGDLLADLHGQHEHQSLLRSDGQRDALDRCAGALDLRERTAELDTSVRALDREHQDLARDDQDRVRREETLARELQDIERVSPRAGEEADLLREESLLRNGAEVARLAGEAFALLSDDDASAVTRLAGAEERLARLASIDPEAARAAALARDARLAASEAAASLSGYLDAGEFDPVRLEQVAGRLAELDRLKRRYGPSLEEVLAHLEEGRASLAALAEAPEKLKRLEEDLASARASYLQAAEALSARRLTASRQLARAVQKELEAMAMASTRVEIALDRLDPPAWGSHGLDRIEFLIAPNAGEGLRPLSRIASGGELSRLMLAVRNASAAHGDARTLIFDEVDSGVGGRVAETVGERLAALGRRQQVLCVTHLPQIAALADRHFRIGKHTAGGRTRAEVTLLDREGRVEELARMLGGSPSDTARRHAAAMITRRTGAPSA
ncbi:MAG: DNA repair protein RecN [Candidatus Polarisedimenticolia bacterium]